MKPRKNVNVKQNVNEYIGYEFLALNDVETGKFQTHICI
jgi:hypothetical protein